MKVLIACEFSGIVRDAFLAAGHEAYSCDILDPQTITLLTHKPIHPNHLIQDAISTAYDSSYHWDLIISHPPCTYLSAAQYHLLYRSPQRRLLSEQAKDFALALLNAPVRYTLIENPPGLLSKDLRFPIPQTIPLKAFGDPSPRRLTLYRSKSLPKLQWTHNPNDIPTLKHMASDKESIHRGLLRSITTPGLARALATQYGSLPTN